MARMHGKQVRVYLGARDASADVSDVGLTLTADQHERTTFADAGWRAFDPGLKYWTMQLTAFHDPATGGITQQLESLFATTNAIVSVYDGDADAVGDVGFVGSSGILTDRTKSATVSDLVKMQVTIRGVGRAGVPAVLLHPKGSESATGNAAAVDNGSSTAKGGRGTLHITAISGTWTIRIQHSADNIAWTDLITFTQATTTGAESKEVTATVNRYIRATHTADAAGTITYVVGFARY